MKTAEQTVRDNIPEECYDEFYQMRYNTTVPLSYAVERAVVEYAKEVLADYDNWKAHKTPDLVKQYIKERGL